MGKRSNFERREKDFYPTPEAAVLPLLPFLKPNTKFYEPCVGGHDLERTLIKHGHVSMGRSDEELDARSWYYLRNWPEIENFITNPPWRRDLLHGIISNLSSQRPTWLLFDADWMH